MTIVLRAVGVKIRNSSNEYFILRNRQWYSENNGITWAQNYYEISKQANKVKWKG
jgi:hypothetical protein